MFGAVGKFIQKYNVRARLVNGTFIIVGYEYYDDPKRFIFLRGKINKNVYTDMDEIPPGSDYFVHDLKSRGVIIGD